MDPLFFPMSAVNTGFAAGNVTTRSIRYTATPGDTFLCAGAGSFVATGACSGLSGYQLSFAQDLQPPHQNPQARGSTPSPSDPFIADSIWTVTNTSGVAFTDPLVLLFTNVNLSDPLLLGSPYPDIPTGLDANMLELLQYRTGGASYFYGAVPLGSLDAGASTQLTVRYVVNGPLPLNPAGTDLVMPPLGVLGLVVPEPSSLLLLGLGLAGLASAGRSRA